MVDEKELENQDAIEEKLELTDEEKMRFRLQEADVELERYEDIPVEEMTEEQYNKMIELKTEIKSLRKELKNVSKKEASNTIWERLNIWYIAWGVLAFIILVYPLGPLVSAYYLTLLKPFLTSIAKAVSNATLQKIIVFVIYLLYFVLYFIVDLVFYRFIKKNKTNFWSMIVIISVHFIASLISVLFVIDSFF